MKNLLIVFLKNPIAGKVKTRLATEIGNESALAVYKALLERTRQACSSLQDIEIRVYYSDFIQSDLWPDQMGSIQTGTDLGARMKNAFRENFELGYCSISCIGTDLPEMSKDLIHEAFHLLEENSVVLGPAEDGGYYLIGMNRFIPELFEDISWSTSDVLKQTIAKLDRSNTSYGKLQTLNDIDTYDDLKRSSLFPTDQK